MADETDGVGETFDDTLRIALTVASQFGERISRLREQLARQREADARQEARELQARFDAERGAARAQLAVVNQPEWWTRASVEDIAAVHETATAWRDHDDTAAAAANDTIRREVRERYGLEVDRPGADPAAVAQALQEAERDRARAAEERRRSGEDLTASQILLGAAEARDGDADEASTRAWEADAPDAAAQADREATEAAQDARGGRDDSSAALRQRRAPRGVCAVTRGQRKRAGDPRPRTRGHRQREAPPRSSYHSHRTVDEAAQEPCRDRTATRSRRARALLQVVQGSASRCAERAGHSGHPREA